MKKIWLVAMVIGIASMVFFGCASKDKKDDDGQKKVTSKSTVLSKGKIPIYPRSSSGPTSRSCLSGHCTSCWNLWNCPCNHWREVHQLCRG